MAGSGYQSASPILKHLNALPGRTATGLAKRNSRRSTKISRDGLRKFSIGRNTLSDWLIELGGCCTFVQSNKKKMEDLTNGQSLPAPFSYDYVAIQVILNERVQKP